GRREGAFRSVAVREGRQEVGRGVDAGPAVALVPCEDARHRPPARGRAWCVVVQGEQALTDAREDLFDLRRADAAEREAALTVDVDAAGVEHEGLRGRIDVGEALRLLGREAAKPLAAAP